MTFDRYTVITDHVTLNVVGRLAGRTSEGLPEETIDNSVTP